MQEMTIKRNDGGQRLDKFLLKALPSLPPSLLYKAIRTKKIKVNRKRAEGNQLLCEGDVLQLFLAPEFFENGGKKSELSSRELARVKTDLHIIYEDENILLINKRAGLSVHSDKDGGTSHLLALLHAYLFQKGEYDPASEQSFAPALCNRIDRNTQGIVIAAKTAEALRIMDEKIRERELKKEYLCAVHGVPKEKHAVLDGWLMKDEKTNKVRVFHKNPPHGAKDIRTEYEILAQKDGLSLLKVLLHTGRTHQIRAHMASIGHPLLGDGKYGKNQKDREKGFKSQALCSYQLTFTFDTKNPTSLDYLNGKTFTIPKEEVHFLSLFS